MRVAKLVLCGLAVLALVPLLAPVTLAGKGGKPKPPPVPADPAIAFVEGGSNLVVMNADGSNRTVIHTGDRLTWPSWSPDGNHLAFNEGSSLRRLDVAVVDGAPRGTNVTTLLADAWEPRWSPAGGEILYHTGGRGGSLRVVPASGGTPTTLYTTPSNVGVECATWSPAAGKIAFVEAGNPGAWIKVLDRDAETVTTRLSLPPTFIPRLDWGRTADVVVYEVKSYPNKGKARSRIHTLDLDDDTTTDLFDGGDPGWSPDDTKVVYSSGAVFVRDLSSGITEKLARDGRWPDWRR